MNLKSLFTIVALASLQSLYASDQTSASQQSSTSTDSTGSSPQDVRFSKLKDANIVSSSGESLGKMEDLIINQKTGNIDYVILGRGGLLGMGEKRVPVPWKAVHVSSEKQFTINVDKNKLKSAPTVGKDYSELNQPDYYVTIYRFYEIPVESGSANSPGGSQSGAGSSTNSSSQSENQK